jgi:hypothetical protein
LPPNIEYEQANNIESDSYDYHYGFGGGFGGVSIPSFGRVLEGFFLAFLGTVFFAAFLAAFFGVAMICIYMV